MRTAAVRKQIELLVHARPFRPFVITLENGQRIPIEHPENLAYVPGMNGGPGDLNFSVVSSRLLMYGTFDAVTSIAVLDEGQQVE